MKEQTIRKSDTLDAYLKLVNKDIKELFDFNSFLHVSCPACQSRDHGFEFEKAGFKYNSCRKCLSLFVSPRPKEDALKRFYSKSASTHFWIEDFFKPVAEIRREKIFAPRAQYVADKFANKQNSFIGDIGAGFGIFLEEIRKLMPQSKFLAIEPSLQQAEICRSKKFNVECSTLEDLNGYEEKFDLLTGFELLEHVFSPGDFLKIARRFLKPGGHLLITTLNGLGFDIGMLWEKSKSVNPPHHLNFLNPRSLEILFKDCGFEILETSTPGKLDWDIAEGMIKRESISLGRFWDNFAKGASQKAKDQLQNWISSNGFSSHMMVTAKKL